MKIFKAIKKGFTLVELVIVIAVIAVLSAVLIPVFGNVVKDSRVSALKASLKTCTSNLIMYSLYNQVDYYTPSVIREFLKSEGIKGLTSDDSEFCEDGYSIWYNQQNYNFYLVKNDELADFVNGATSTASVNNVNDVNKNSAAFAADIFGNVADGGVTQGSGENAGASDQLQRIPRRPEAITPNENLLLVATDEANKGILSGIETLYNGADTDKGNTSAQNIIIAVQNAMDHCDLFNSFSDWKIEDYTNKFNVNSTAWLNNVGNFITDAEFNNVDGKSIADISNVIVSPNLGSFSETGGNEITGNIRKFGETINLDSAVLNVSCVIEIASTNAIELVEQFYQRFSNAGVNIVISGNVTIDSTVSSSVSSGTNKVSTVTGGGKNISSVVSAGGGSAVSGGGSKIISSTISSSEFLGWTTAETGGEAIIKYSTVSKANNTTESGKDTLVSIKLPDGQVKYETVGEDFFRDATVTVDEKKEKVQYKYNTSSFSINVSEFLKKVGITSDDQVRSVKIKQDSYNNVYTTSVYLEYEINNVIYGKSFNFGVGHITSFDYYYRFYNANFDSDNKSGENTVPQYFGVTEGSDNTNSNNAGSLTVKLPDGTLNLQSYKEEDFTIEVYYNETTRYYTSEKSEFGTEFKVFSHESVATEEKRVTWGGDNKTKINGYYLVDFGSHNRLGDPTKDKDGNTKNADYFVNTVTINRIVIRDKDNNIMIVKYPG